MRAQQDAGRGELSAAVDIRMLGPLEALRGGQRLSLGGQRQRSVLACLLLEVGHSVTTDRIIDEVWGERPPTGVQTTLQTYVFHLREALEPPRGKGDAPTVIVTVPGGYRLESSAVAVDAARFEALLSSGRQLLDTDPAAAAAALEEALALWRGDVLSDLPSLDGAVTPVAGRLDELRMVATELWADAALRLGRSDVLASLDELAVRHPLREHLAALRMLAMYRAGRQADALAAYRHLRQTLDDELGIQPSAEVEMLNQRILRQDPALEHRPPQNDSARVAEPPVVAVAPSGKPDRPYRSRRRRWLAVGLVGALAASVLVGTVVKAVRWDLVTPVPPNTLAVLSDHGLDGDPLPLTTTPGAIATGAGAVWVADEADDAVMRIDPDSHRIIQTISGVGGAPQSVAVAHGDVWIAGARDGVVVKVSAVTNRVVDRVSVGVQPAAVVATPDQVWVANSADNTVQRIDPATDRAGEPIAVGDGPDGLILEGTTLWVANSRSGTVTELDTRTGDRLTADIRVDVGARGMTLTDTEVWVANELGQSVSRIDRASKKVVTIPVEDGPSSVVISAGSAWVNNAYSGTVSRVDLETNRVSRMDLHSSPRALALVGGEIWVSTGAFGSPEHQGGTLVFTEYREDVGTLDPAVFGAASRIAILRHVYDGLVSFRVTGGRGSGALVPDLATNVPIPSDGGLTYTFTIRPGIRYSTGAEVTASDFVYGLRRVLANTDGASPFDKVIGAKSCIGMATLGPICNLREGADADDVTRRVTIHLAEPDPNFLEKLTYSVVPTPAGTPLGNLKFDAVVPGTGPYLISNFRVNGDFTLSRNPYFQPWSFAAQPAAYPDHIEYRIAPSADLAITDVIAGRADVTTVSAADMSKLSGHADLVHDFQNFDLDFAYLNTKIPPFDNRKARQAINYAVDRRTFVSLFGGGEAGADISCQLLPQGLSAWRRYCPYQTGSATGPYQGPDVTRAKELVSESGTADIPITVRAYRGYPLWDRFPDYLADVLRSIGYTHVAVEDIPSQHNGMSTDDPAYAGYQIFTQLGWLADYDSPSDFYDELASCRHPNISGYCNPVIEAVAARAATAAETNPTLSIDLWAQVDRMVTDDAAVLTLGSHHDASLVSPRVSNVLTRRGLGAVLSQLWVQ